MKKPSTEAIQFGRALASFLLVLGGRGFASNGLPAIAFQPSLDRARGELLSDIDIPLGDIPW